MTKLERRNAAEGLLELAVKELAAAGMSHRKIVAFADDILVVHRRLRRSAQKRKSA